MSRGPRGDRRGRNSPGSSALTSPSDRLQIGFVLLVGLSGATMALQGGASPVVVGAAALGGLVAGAGLLWYLRWIVDE